MENAINMTKSAITHLLLLLSLAGLGVDSQEALLDDDLDRQPMDCFKANETCFSPSSSTSCRNSIMLLYTVCGRSWKYCDSANVEFCRSHLKAVSTRTVFKGCVCYDSGARYRQCDNLWKLLNQNPCQLNPVKLRPPGETDSDVVVDAKGYTTDTGPTEPRQKKRREKESMQDRLDSVGVKRDSGQGPSCLTVMRKCSDSHTCQLLRTDFLNNCRFNSCDRNSDACLYTYENIRVFHVFNCTCMGIPRSDKASRMRCQEFRSQFVDNRCLALMNSQTLYGFNLGKKTSQDISKALPNKPYVPATPERRQEDRRPGERERPVSKPQWRRPEPESCFNVYRECVQSSLNCLVRVINLSESCQGDPARGGRCRDHGRCMNALKGFYSDGMRELAVRAMVCNCREGDRDCIAKRSLLRPSCTFEEKGDTCLGLIKKCFRDDDCQFRYKVYNQICSDEIMEDGCPSNPEKCLDAHRLLWGTNLTQHCSCPESGVPLEFRKNQKKMERYIQTCKQLEKVLKNPPCLREKYEIGRMSFFSQRVPRPTTVEERRSAACRSRLGSGVREATIRLYHNDSCSDLCQCTQHGQVQCRVLPCSNSQPCRRPTSLHHNGKCQCVFGELVCPPAPMPLLMENSPPGFYLSVGFSPSERRVLQQHSPSGGPDFANMSRVLTWVLNSTTGGVSHLCQLQLESQTSASALYRVRLVERRPTGLGRARTVLSECDYPIRLLKLMIEAGDPAIRSHPHLSLMRQARILNSAATYSVTRPNRRLPSPRQVPENTSHRGAATSMARPGWERVGLQLAGCLLAWRRALPAA